jgi:hypothetical protein
LTVADLTVAVGAPKVQTVPSASSAMAWSVPASIIVTAVSPGARTGLYQFLSVPLRSWPLVLSPSPTGFRRS